MKNFEVTQSLGDIVAIMPKASEVFKKYNIDFCCGGQRPLGEAIKEKKLNEKEVLEGLNVAFSELNKSIDDVDFREVPSSELIDYIVNTHHVFVAKILPEISELTTKILRVHGTNHNDLFRIHKLAHDLKTELDQHLIKEEEILFPMIKEYDKAPSSDLLERIKKTMKETEDEHEVAGDVLKELRKITVDYAVPKDGCTTYLLTYKKLQELESDLFQHIHLENNILFKRLGIDLKN